MWDYLICKRGDFMSRIKQILQNLHESCFPPEGLFIEALIGSGYIVLHFQIDVSEVE
jgi:uncharacterized protein (AIM24 family)